MKTQFNKYMIVLGILAPAVVFAQTGFQSALPEGSYRGKFRGQDSGKVNLLTQSIRGCEGCFIAVLFKNQNDNKRIEAFKALPTKNESIVSKDGTNINALKTSSEYDLIPLGVDTDGEITTPNDNPSLVLTVQKNIGTPQAEFVITSAQSNNNSGTQSSMVFTGGSTAFDLDEGDAGRYKTPMKIHSVGSINIISQNSQDGSNNASATLLEGGVNNTGGTFSVKEKAPGVFTFTAVSHLATGTVAKQNPDKIIIFMKKFGRERAYLVNPTKSTDIGVLKVMN